MPLLEIRDDVGHVRTQRLSKLQPISIGSHPANDIRVDNVADMHSRISWNNDQFRVVAAGADEIDVNGKSTRQASLGEGDVLTSSRNSCEVPFSFDGGESIHFPS